MKRRKTGEGMKKMRKTPEKQYQLAVDGIRPLNVQDSKDRLLAFCMDVSIMLCPIALWNIILLAVLGNIISISAEKFSICGNHFFSRERASSFFFPRLYGRRRRRPKGCSRHPAGAQSQAGAQALHHRKGPLQRDQRLCGAGGAAECPTQQPVPHQRRHPLSPGGGEGVF